MLEVRTNGGGKQPCANDVVCLWAHIHWENIVEQAGVINPEPSNLWSERRGGPGIHHVGFAYEPASNTALRFGEPVGNVSAWVDGQDCLIGHKRLVVVGFARSIQSVPQRYWHTEISLAANKPVAVQSTNPIGVAVLHEVGVPFQFIAALQQRCAQRFVASAVADVPLTAGNNFERPVALFKEFDGVHDRAWLAAKIARSFEHLNNCNLCLLHSFPSKFGVLLLASITRDSVRCINKYSTVTANDGLGRQLQFAPPNDVG